MPVVIPLVLGIKPFFPVGQDHTIEVIYKSGDKIMRLDQLDDRASKPNAAQKEVDMHGLHWTAYCWRHSDNEWSYL